MSNRADDFNRSNGALNGATPSDGGAAWTAVNYSVNTNRIECTALGYAYEYAYLEASSSVGEASVTLAVKGQSIGPALRMGDGNSYFVLFVVGNQLQLYKRINSTTISQIGSTYSGTISAGDVIKLGVDSSNQFTGYQNGTARVGPVTDSFNSTATKVGFVGYSNSAAARLDDFSFTDLAGGGSSVSPGAGALAVSGQAPTVAQSANQSLTAGAGSVTLQGFAPTVAQSQSVAPGVGALTISGFAPAVSQSASGAVAPDAGAVTLTGYAPSIEQPQTAAPGAGALAITGYAPDVQQASGALPGPGSITITGQAPTVAQTAAQSVAPGTGTLSITGYAPDIAQSGQPQAPSGGVIFGRPPWAKRYVVQHGRRVLVFGTEAAALEAQAAIDKARTIRETAPAATSNRARRRVEKIARSVIASALSTQPPVDSFTAAQLQELTATYASSDTLAELQRLRDFEQMARMWEDLRAEEDDIAAFMELM